MDGASVIPPPRATPANQAVQVSGEAEIIHAVLPSPPAVPAVLPSSSASSSSAPPCSEHKTANYFGGETSCGSSEEARGCGDR